MKKVTKIIAAVLAILISAGATGLYASASKNDLTESTSTQALSQSSNPKSTVSVRSAVNSAAQKDETVYVISNAEGSTKNIIVSDWLKNPAALSSINDMSTLTDIKNVKGDESFNSNGDGLEWAANGADIYYQGTSNQQLPVEMKITYYLDGEETNPSELAGKSGHIKIRFDYTNNALRKVAVDGKSMDMYVPFLMATGTVLDTSKFINIEVSDGKIIADGDKAVVFGYAMPGLKESLALGEDTDINIPDSFEIDADVTNFSLATTVTIATNSKFDSDSNLSIDKDTGELSSSMNELTAASEKLVDGTSELYDGISELLEKASPLTDGIESLYSGAIELNGGAASLSDGLTQLADGAKSLSDGASQLNSSLTTAADGAKGISDGLATVSQGANKLSDGIKSADNGITALSSGIDTAAESLDQTIAANKQVLQGLEAVYSKSKSSDVADMISALKQTIAGQEKISASLKDGNGGIKDGANALKSGTAQLQSGVTSLNGGIAKLTDGAANLSGGMNQLSIAGGKLVKGASTLYTSAQSASNGANTLYSGTTELKNGTASLKDGASALIDGITQLKDGALELKNGMNEFNEKGIKKLLDIFSGDLQGLMDKIDALKAISKEYNSYSGISDDMNGTVKFIYTTEEISCE